MRLKFLAKLVLIASCSVIFVATVTSTGYSAEPCMAVPLLGAGMQVPCVTVPEPAAGIITYALGLLGVGIVALRSKLGR